MEENTNRNFDSCIYQMIDFSPLLVIILDTNLNIKALNFKLTKLLTGDETNRDFLIGQSWLQYVSNSDKTLVEKIHRSLIGKYQLNNELVHSIIDFEGDLISAQWYNSYINSDLRWVFSIGVQEIKKTSKMSDIDEARKFYTQELKKDKALIEIVKEVAVKYTESIMSKNKEVSI